MANEYRWMQDFAYGTLTVGIAASDTSVASNEFSELPAVTSGSTYIPIELVNDLTRQHETVWITNHTAGSTSATIARGKEFTGALDWPNGSRWVCAVTPRDLLGFLSEAALPSDANVGMRALVGDKGEVREKTLLQGFLGYARMNGADMGRAVDGTTSHPAGAVPQAKTWVGTGTTNGSGLVTFAIPNGGFPTRVVTAQLTKATTTWFVPTVDAGTTTKTVLGVLCQQAVGSVLGTTAVIIDITAIGY